MATAGEPTEAVEQVGEDTAEAMEQVGEETAQAMEQVGEETAEAIEQIGEQTTEATDQGGEESSDPMEVAGEKPTEAMEQNGEEPEVADAEEEAARESLRPALPLGRVKRIIRVDRDIKKVTNEAAMLIAAATELFVGNLAAGAHTAAAQRGRRAVRAAHVRAAARAHRPTADFLLDCLPADEEAPRARSTAGAGSSGGGGGGGGGGGRGSGEVKPLPRGTRRIDALFQKVT